MLRFQSRQNCRKGEQSGVSNVPCWIVVKRVEQWKLGILTHLISHLCQNKVMTGTLPEI